MLTKPADSRTINANSTARSAGVMSSVACGSVGTGTATAPDPRLPSTMTRTCQAPARIIHSCPVYSRGSSLDRAVTSDAGANSAPGPDNGSGTIRTSRISGSKVRTSTPATPGIARGGLTVTSTRYGPARASRNTSGLPT
jgi:hypothetical protein